MKSTAFFLSLLLSTACAAAEANTGAGANGIFCVSRPPHVKIVLAGQILDERRILLSVDTEDGSGLTQYLNQPFGLRGYSNDDRFAIYLGGRANEYNFNLAFILSKKALTEPGQNFRAIYKWSEFDRGQKRNYEVYMTCLRQ